MCCNPDNTLIFFLSENFLSSTSQTSSKKKKFARLSIGMYLTRPFHNSYGASDRRRETKGVKLENQNNCLNYLSLESYKFEVQIPQKNFPNKLTFPEFCMKPFTNFSARFLTYITIKPWL